MHVRDDTCTIVARFACRVQEGRWMRQFIATERTLVGHALEETVKQDLMCIVYGCRVPMILRRCDDKKLVTTTTTISLANATFTALWTARPSEFRKLKGTCRLRREFSG
ncbi:hypothetical protein N7G274_009051 [Stereocaulon virgatum]|uniref:Uncharacterized protein n=1 Tax=Stereocaulon virgatum TaxID=373712 RepID=A0ABR3ZZY4_9LECA